MRPITLLGCSVLSLAATGCVGPPPEPPVGNPTGSSAGSHFTLTLSSPQNSNVSGGTYETTFLTGGFSGTVGGVSVSAINASYGTNTAANHVPCQLLMGVIFRGKPEAGKQWQLLDDLGESAPGTGTFSYADTCPDPSKPRQWLSASGTLRIDSVTDPDPRAVPAGSPAGSLKTVKFTLADVKMVPSENSANATGTFTLHGEGRVELMSGMDKP